MAVSNAMFLFEVVVEKVTSLVESRFLVIRSDFADIFSLELKDPKEMHIVIPEPPPLPPEPPGKKGKKKKPPKPKKGKKGAVVLPPPEPVIQSGQSVLFSSTAEFLIQSMKKFPLEVSLWSREDNLVYIGATYIPWDPIFLGYLEKICNCQMPEPVKLNEEYNVFEEDTAKLMAKLSIQIKLSYLTDKVTTAFRTLSEDPNIKRVLYTGINSKTTSYICTMKTTDEDFEENCNKIENNYTVDKPKVPKVVYASFKNAPGANLTFFKEGDYCCMGNADKPPDSIYKSPETCPDVDFITDYVRKIIVSCNDNMRMLTPRPTIRPRIKATDVDRLCYCKETSWPDGKLAEAFKKEVQGSPCPICIGAGKRSEGRGATFDIENIRGPCGKATCRIARDMRAYIENLVEEDNKEFEIGEIVGPCGSKSCTLAEKVHQFLRHEGPFAQINTLEGLSTQCACLQTMQDALKKQPSSCDSDCPKDCEESGSDASKCEGKKCPFTNDEKKVYNVYYFTVSYDFDDKSKGTSTPASESSKFKHCDAECPSLKAAESAVRCSKSICSTTDKKDETDNSKCPTPVCPHKEQYPASPADSDVIINLSDINNPCCVKSCDAADKVKDFIVDIVTNKKPQKIDSEDTCYCDCVCDFNFSNKTTYCAVCGGYECLGEDVKKQPEYAKPHPCPVYHKLYDKKYIKVESAFPDEEKKIPPDSKSIKSSKTITSKSAPASQGKLTSSRSIKNLSDKKSERKIGGEEKTKKVKKEKKKIEKITSSTEKQPLLPVEPKPEVKYPYPPVPKHMGWNWNAEDIPGMKPRPKWRPGACNKILVRRYKALRGGIDTIARKKRAMMQKKKKVEMKPTLVVTKHDGEYTVSMEVFKKYSKERLLFQYPYEEKNPIVYTIGKTEQEKQKIMKQRDRRERRETRRKSKLIQSTFRDRCQEICVKAYNQAIGLLPLPNPNDPECPCQTAVPGDRDSPVIDSCSCSDEGTISSDDTDGDEWTIEFSPPAARFDAKAKHPPTLVENESQYTYLDYKVKLLDKNGNPIPRFFTGPDGKQECSDLGGFWGPDKVWLEINKDGYLGPDNRWVPMNFIGPDGMFYSAEEGSFTDNKGQLLKIGVDGYIDKDNKWAWYPKKRGARSTKSKSTVTASTTVNAKKAKVEVPSKSKDIIKRDVASHRGKGDKKSQPLETPPAKGKPNMVKKTVSYSSDKIKKPLIMNVSLNYDRNELPRLKQADRIRYIDSMKMARYKEIMEDLQMYDDLGEMKPPMKTNRASNTPMKITSPYTMQRNNSQSLAIVKSFGNRLSRSLRSDNTNSTLIE